MNVIFVSSRGRGRSGQQNRPEGDTVNVSVPCDLVMGLLSQGAILQMQIGPVPLRPDLARPAPRPDSARTNPIPDSGRSQTRITRPTRPASRCSNQDVRPISPYTDWFSLADEAEADVISIYSDNSDNNYVPHSPVYEPDSPGPNPVEESEDWDPMSDNLVEVAPEGPHSEPSRTVFSNIFTDS